MNQNDDSSRIHESFPNAQRANQPVSTGVSAPAAPAAAPLAAEQAGPPVTAAPAGSMTAGVMQDGGDQGGGIVAKLKQFKTKVTERPGKDGGPPSWLVEVGSAQVKVYVTPFRGKEFFTVSYWVDRKRIRRVYPTQEEAIAEAKEAGKRLAKGVAGVPEVSSADWACYSRSRQILDPLGIPLERGAALVAHIVQRLAGRATPEQAIEYFLKRHPHGMVVKKVEEVVKECLEAKRKDGLSARYLRQLGYDLARFKGRFRNYLGDVSGVMIDDWLRSLDLAPRTRNNLRASFQVLFNFAKARRYLAKDHDEMASVSAVKDADGEIGIFRPGELRELLTMAKPELVPAVAIGAFAGVRHEEIQRLDWQDIKLKAGIIEIRAAKAKTASRRTIPIVPSLKAWLLETGHDEEGRSLRAGNLTGPVCPFLDFTRQLLKLAAAVNEARIGTGRATKGGKGEFKWQHNGLRHSFISYRVALVKNVNEVALEAGNSPQMIFQHYRELVTPQDAKAWFAITPGSVKAMRAKAERERRAKIVAFPVKAAA